MAAQAGNRRRIQAELVAPQAENGPGAPPASDDGPAAAGTASVDVGERARRRDGAGGADPPGRRGADRAAPGWTLRTTNLPQRAKTGRWRRWPACRSRRRVRARRRSAPSPAAGAPGGSTSGCPEGEGRGDQARASCPRSRSPRGELKGHLGSAELCHERRMADHEDPHAQNRTPGSPGSKRPRWSMAAYSKSASRACPRGE